MTLESKSHTLALLIPTRNRRIEITRLLDSIQRQSRLPDLVMIIDGGTDSVKDLIAHYPSLRITHLSVFPPGLTRQRNAGLKEVPNEMTFVGFLDDDLELMPDALEHMMAFWKMDGGHYAGASFNILNNIPNNVSWISRLFLVNTPQPGVVLSSGFHTVVAPVHSDTPTQWLCGGATVWRADILKGRTFDEFYSGYGFCEDLDFSYGVRQQHPLIVLKEACVNHHSTPVRPGRERVFWATYMINRYYFVRKYHLSKAAYWWASVGQMANAFAQTLKHLNRQELLRMVGLAQGAWDVVTGNTARWDTTDIK